MSEVPEHLLARSRARRSALGLGGDAPAEAPAAAATGATVEKAVSSAPAPKAKAAMEVVPKVVVPPPHYVQAALRRKKVPVWAMPVVAFLPVWGILYAQTLSSPPSIELTQLEEGKAVFASSSCNGCHGPAGAGGSGRKLNEGEVLKTFPDIMGQVEFVNVGTKGVLGATYGNPQRESGAHKPGETGRAMPAFHDALTPLELFTVIRHEREVLSGEEIPPEQIGPDGELLWPNGTPMVDASGELVGDDGQPMFDAKGYLLARPAYELAGAAGGETAAAPEK